MYAVGKPFATFVANALKDKDYAKFEAGPGFMRLTVENIGPGLVSVAHWSEQNGDLMRDPEIVFLAKEGKLYPVSFRNDFAGAFLEYVTFENGEPKRFSPRGQRDLVSFCSTWISNIKAQGYLSGRCVAA